MPHLLVGSLLFALFVSGCDIFGGDDPVPPPAADTTKTQLDLQPSDGSCQPRGVACSDTTVLELSEGSSGTRLRSWNPETRSFWEIQMGPDGEVIPQTSYLHDYSIENNDSVVYWFMASEQVENGEALPLEYNRFRVTPDGDTLHLAGWSERHYDADGHVTRETRYNAKNQVVEDWVVSRNAEDQEMRLSVLCGPEQKEPCATTSLEFHPDYGEVSVSRKWDPTSRRYWELMWDRQEFLIESESFLRIPDGLGRDSLVFWIQSVQENDTVAKGWNENIYSSENRIQEIRYFEIEFADSSLYAYEKFDNAGNRIEYMENGFVDVYNQDQNVVRAFSIGGDLHGYPIKAGFNSEDTTLYFYGDEGELLERRDVSGTEIEEQVLYEYWTGSGLFKQILSKNQERIRINEYLADGRLQSVRVFTLNEVIQSEILKSYIGADSLVTTYDELGEKIGEVETQYYPSGLPEKKLHRDAAGMLVLTQTYNPDGLLISTQEKEGPIVACLEPLQGTFCKTEEETPAQDLETASP